MELAVPSKSPLAQLLEIMRRLRAPDGCPWDRQQTSASIAPYTIEEAYEVADAIERGDAAALRDELGDLLFQVIFHAEMARETGAFDFDAVAAAIRDKLVRRHPHVFSTVGHVFAADASVSAAEQSIAWEDIKARERASAARERAGVVPSHLDGVPQTLPALMRADKLSKRAARVGFDFEYADQTADKVAEELLEVREAVEERAAQRTAADPVGGQSRIAAPQVFEEVGDLLFAAANLARKLDVDAEAALRAANGKFERRFRAMEALAAKRGEEFARLDLASQERLWQDVKRGE
jgi:MazG family protein